uniref:Glycerol-3-phosphate acyltransferase 1, mitochondrial n=1 Tax=Sander lucioperca TaxID=283035 RepID=A0A8C9Z9Z0_SANLU
MELSDGFLLQVNNGEQWCNRWKHPNDDSVSHRPRPTIFFITWKEGLLNRKRPFVGRCCHSCTPQSWVIIYDNVFTSLHVSVYKLVHICVSMCSCRQRGWLARRLSYVLFVMERDVNKDMFTRNVVDNVLNNSRVESAIVTVATDLDAAASLPGQEHKAISKVKQKARAFLQEMVANISPAFIRLTGWVLLRLFNGFFWSIQIHKGQLEMVKKAATEQNVPMVFLPVHKSHIDYLLITLILFCHNIKAPHIAAGNNLSIPILSTLIRKLGGFFIRRRMEETGDGKKDILYRSLLHAVKELLRQQQFLEVYLEGTRSRSGKPSTARAGMLSIVVDTMCTGSIADVLVVPVGISYDRILEGNYNSEQLGKPKKNESLWGIACGVFRMLRKNYGCVRVDFNQPFSLKVTDCRFISAFIQKNYSCCGHMRSFSRFQLSLLILKPDAQLFEGQEEEEQQQLNRELPDDLSRRQLINNLAKHVLFTANKSSAIMSTHIVACLLLYRHRQGVVLSKLDVVMRALHLLGNCVNVTSSSNRNGEFTIAPSQTVPALFELNFYSNCLFHVFISDAIIAESESDHPPDGLSSLPLSQERLIRKAAGLSHFLVNEVTVAPPCQTIYQVFHDAVTRLIQYGVLYVAEEDQEELSPSPTEEPWPKKFPEPLSWRSDEEDEDSDFGEEQRDRYLKVSVSPEHQEFFVFLQRLVSPVLEAYSGAAIFVHSLSQPMAESDYTQRLFRYLLTRTERGVAAYGESATHYLVKNTVRTFKELGVLKQRRENEVTTLELSSTFLPQANRNKLLQYILGFTLL